ncbi:sodium/solute symporter [Luteolibacter pohnpeiensis]|uniref:Sodium/solute symporter n=1 Tax=Luteolibacter pohnpeiensis TaxID=454153 RepID=A0A934SEN3_9BACT|nr:sodium/solute symporter [Luteolibacter pohnpeiensis]MBK1883803.1 sodium/solute symporter [Luteolibacter pohnpeiensis]
MSTLDVVLFLVAVIGVIAFGIWQGNKESGAPSDDGAAGYFLAGRGLTWWLVGFSLIAANISTEQFVGMSGSAADWLGMAIASYEWMAAITLVVVAFVFLPKLLRCGIYTIPEFLEYRYGLFSRNVMAISTLVILVGVPTASVIYSGAKVISVFFAGYHLMGMDLGSITVGCWIIGIAAAIYVFVGGLKACAWTDLIWGASLIVGGAIVMFLAFGVMRDADPAELILTKVENSTATQEDIAKAGPFERFMLLNNGKHDEAKAVTGENLSGGKLHMVRPHDDPTIPWPALLLGLWIPNFFYWGLNQYIVQRTLGSKSLAEGQKGIVFAAALKLIVPFIVVIPGILCFNLYSSDLRAQGAMKNSKTLKEMRAAKDTSIYPFTENFALTEPDLAREVIAHNETISGLKAATLAPDASAESITKVNSDLLKAAKDKKIMIKGKMKKIPTGTKLLGYDYDSAFPTLLKNLLKPGFTWFVLAAIFGAVVSSLASMLNSASTIATMDIVRKLKPESSQSNLVAYGRGFTLLFVLIACVIAPSLGSPAFGGIFNFIQEFQGFISPGILAVYLFGFLIPQAPRFLGWLGISINIVLYGTLMWKLPDMAFLNRMAICFVTVLIVLTISTLAKPLDKPVVMPTTDLIVLESSKVAKICGIAVVISTLILYFIFW